MVVTNKKVLHKSQKQETSTKQSIKVKNIVEEKEKLYIAISTLSCKGKKTKKKKKLQSLRQALQFAISPESSDGIFNHFHN